MGTARTVAKNSAMTLLSSLSVKALGLLFAVYAVRYLGAEQYGKYAFVFSLMTLFSVLSSMGLDNTVVIDAAKDPGAEPDILANSAALRGVLVLSSWAALFAAAPFLGKGPEVGLGMAVVGFCLLPDAVTATFKAAFSGRQRMELNTLVEVLYRCVFVGLGLSAVFFGAGLRAFFLVPLAASLSALAAAAFLYRGVLGGGFGEIRPSAWPGIIERGYPFMLAGLMTYAYRGLDMVMISLMRGDAAAGVFSSARALTDSFLFLPAAVSGALLPAFSRINVSGSLAPAYAMSMKLLVAAGLLLTAAVSVFAPDIVAFVYGPAFAPAVPVLKVLTFSTGLAFANIIMTTALAALGRQKALAAVVFLMAALSVFLNLLLVPEYGPGAAAWAAVAAEAAGVLACGLLVRARLGPATWHGAALKGGVAAAAFCCTAFLLRPFGFWAALGGGLAAYFAVLLPLKPLDGRETDVLRRIFHD